MTTQLSQIKLLAKNKAIDFTHHAFKRMLERGISVTDVQQVLTSNTVQIIENQPSTLQSTDKRVLIYDPSGVKDMILVLVLGAPLRIVTVELVDDSKWIRNKNGIPALIRV